MVRENGIHQQDQHQNRSRGADVSKTGNKKGKTADRTAGIHRKRCCQLLSGGLVCSILLVAVLFLGTTSSNNALVTVESSNVAKAAKAESSSTVRVGATDSNDTWYVYADETLRVYFKSFVKELRFKVIRSDPNVRAAVFGFKNNCPSLTGPKLPLSIRREYDMPGNEFRYTYYNLYRGSTIDVLFDQLKGSSYFYLLEGAKALEDIENGINTDPGHWERINILSRYVDPNMNHQISDVHYKVRGKNENNIYTLVYDNTSVSRVSSLDVEERVVMSTYDLDRYKPICDNMSYGTDSCRLKVKKNNCVIIEAFNVADHTPGEGRIDIQVQTVRNLTAIGLFSSIPWLLSVLASLCCYFCCYSDSRSSSSRGKEEKNDLEEPLLLSQEKNDHEDEEFLQLPTVSDQAVPL